MLKNIDCNSISELPSPEQIQDSFNDKYKVTLPVYVLLLYKSASWKVNAPGVLYVTDFTPYEESTYNNIALPLTDVANFELEGRSERGLDRNRVFLINVPDHLFSKVEQDLRETNIRMNDYDFSHAHNCKFEQEGMFLRVVFVLKLYQGYVEGTLISFKTLNRSNIKAYYPDHNSVKSLVSNFNSISGPRVIANASMHFPIELFSSGQKKEVKKNSSFASQKSADESSETGAPAKKRQTTSGMALLFQQHKTSDDTQRDISIDSQPSLAENAVDNNSQIQDCDKFLISTYPFSRMLQVSRKLLEVEDNRVFEFPGCIVGMMPDAPFIVKPFKRTMKATYFKLIVAESRNTTSLSPDSCISLEFHTEREVCDFLLIDEVEELYAHVPRINNSLKTIFCENTHPINLRVRKTVTQGQDMKIPYWTSAVSLNDILQSVES